MISATENMADIAKALRLGVQDILLKPVKDLNRLRERYWPAFIRICLIPASRKKSAFSRTGML
ncbi:response regulator of RpoS [Enterobacter cloacae]|uniref:Response regulator of RpoS n=1 Tax=Enterobacter cloacae TaxID=550 RepID=A0A377LY40_ENTCL|nr:response regulator of RpoS [Enterobacter cloacae]